MMAAKKPPIKRTCKNCAYHKQWAMDPNMGNCHRYPLMTKSTTEHWCGEHKVKQ